MNNQQKKLFNICNKIEKLMYDRGCKIMSKRCEYACIYISLDNIRLTHNFIEPLIEITTKYNVNFEIEYNMGPRIKIY